MTILKSMFDKAKVEEIQKKYANAKLDKFQDEFSTKIAEFLSKEIPLSKMALKGFMIFSFRDWQKRHNTFFADIDMPNIPLEEKLKISKEINEILLEKLTFVLRDVKYKEKLIEGLKKKDIMLKEIFSKQQG
ncbi:MAG: hypothetical protein ACFFC3_11810 [Candidatus Odinarchaeota archaeon]